MCHHSLNWHGSLRLHFHQELKLACLPSTTESKITTLDGKKMKIYSSTKSICHQMPKCSSLIGLQLINQDLNPEFSTLNIQSPNRNESSTPRMKFMMK